MYSIGFLLLDIATSWYLYCGIDCYVLQALVAQVMAATKSSNKLPQEGDDYDYYISFPGFQSFSNKMAQRVDRIISKVIRHQQLPCYWGVEEEGGVSEASQLEEKFETLIEANDALLERAVSSSRRMLGQVSIFSCCWCYLEVGYYRRELPSRANK